jgi:hypothetical protein
MTVDEQISHVFTQLPCLSCNNPQRDFCLAQLGAFFLAHEAGQQPKLPRELLFRRCCKNNHAADGITYVMPDSFDNRSPRPAPTRSGWW